MTDIGLPQWRENRAAALAASEGLRAALAKLGIPERSYLEAAALPEERGAAATSRPSRLSSPRPDATSPPSASGHGRAQDEAPPGPVEP